MSKYYDEKAKERTMKYMKEKRDRIVVGVAKGDKEKYKTHAESKGKSLNALIVELLEADIAAGQTDTSDASQTDTSNASQTDASDGN